MAIKQVLSTSFRFVQGSQNLKHIFLQSTLFAEADQLKKSNWVKTQIE